MSEDENPKLKLAENHVTENVVGTNGRSDEESIKGNHSAMFEKGISDNCENLIGNDRSIKDGDNIMVTFERPPIPAGELLMQLSLGYVMSYWF